MWITKDKHSFLFYIIQEKDWEREIKKISENLQEFFHLKEEHFVDRIKQLAFEPN
jgi:hypothetical protein